MLSLILFALEASASVRVRSFWLLGGQSRSVQLRPAELLVGSPSAILDVGAEEIEAGSECRMLSPPAKTVTDCTLFLVGTNNTCSVFPRTNVLQIVLPATDFGQFSRRDLHGRPEPGGAETIRA